MKNSSVRFQFFDDPRLMIVTAFSELKYSPE